MKKVLLVAFALVSLGRSAMAFDGNAMALHLRKALSLDTRTEIKITSAPVPSGIGDLMVVNAYLGGSPYPIYLTKDEKKYFFATPIDATVDPDKAHEKGISLKKVHAMGSPTAPITIVEYSDLQCSHCKFAHDTIKKELYKNYTEAQVRFVSKYFPLTGHDWAEPAAVAAECASAQKESNYWEVVNYFFTNQEKVTKENVKDKIGEVGKQLNLNSAQLTSCMNAGPALARVRSDKQEGMGIGVNSTPAFFINGRARRGFGNFDDIKVVIEEKLNDLKK